MPAVTDKIGETKQRPYETKDEWKISPIRETLVENLVPEIDLP